MSANIVILYQNETDTSVTELANTYQQFLQQQGYSVLALCTDEYKSPRALWDTITSTFSPDFGITLNLAGFQCLDTDEDSILMKLPCPFAHELFFPPYYVNQYLATRINFNHILYVHNASDEAYIKNYFRDIPAVCTIPTPKLDSTELPLRKISEPSAIMAEINSLPDVFSMLCKRLIKTLKSRPDAVLYKHVLRLLKELGIGKMSYEEEVEIVTMCALASEYVNATRRPARPYHSPEETLTTFLQNANPICENISPSRFS